MGKSRHHGCGRAKCGLCKPWKKWKSNSNKNKKPSERRKLQEDDE